MFSLSVYINSQSFVSSAVSADDITAAIHTAVGIFNQTILKDRCGIDDFTIVETDDEATADIFIRKMHRAKYELQGNLSVEIIPNISETDGKNIYLDIIEIADVSTSYDKRFTEIVCEAVCHELCYVLGIDERIGLHRFGSKEYQKDFGLMLSPYNVYNSNLGKDYYLTDDEIATLKASVSSIVA